MKKETAKKNKLWLWIGLGVVALLAVVGIVLALVLGGGQQGKSGGRPDLYWNIDRVAFTKDSEVGLSTREAAADGLFYVKFAYNGEQVELPVADKRLINFIDTMDLMGLVIDDDGIVIDAVDPSSVAVEKAKSIYFVEAKDGMIKTNSVITLNGLAMEFAITENTQVYNMSHTATMVGEIIQPEDIQLMDTIHIYANDQDEITHVYLADSPVQSQIYWRVDQFWSDALKGSTRVPDENGVYTVPFWCEGELVEVKSKDYNVVSEIDRGNIYYPHSAFSFDEEGYAIARINTGTATRTIAQVDGYDVMEIDGNNISTQPYGSGTPYNFKITENTRIYDVSYLARALGTAGQRIDSLQINDRVSVWTDRDNNAVLIYVSSRRAESTVYFNVTRQWDSTEKSTKRTANADGLYEIELWTEEEGTKTYLMNLDQVNMVDGEDYRICGIKADGKLVQEVYPLESLFGYPAVCNGRWVTDITGNIFTILSANYNSSNWLMTPDCKVYDVSDTKNPCVTELRVGDNVRVFRNPPGEVVCIFVCARQMGGDALYYNLNHQYDDVNKCTKRLPDENGWYVFDMAYKGKQIQVKTKDRELANTVESFSPGAVCLVVENGIIKEAYDPNTAHCGKKVASAYYFEGYDEDGKAIFSFEGRDNEAYELSEDLEVFDVSTNSFRNRGARTTVQKGDWVTCFTDMYGKLRVIFVRSRTADCAAYNFQRMYDTNTASTTRVPDADGWYIFQMAIDGKCKTLKTKDKELASEIDYQSTNAIGLVLNGDVITGYTLARSIPGISANGTRGYDIVKISGRTLTLRYTMPGSVNTDKEQTITIASNAKVYDVSTGDIATFGQKINFSSLKVGDRITTMRDADDNHALVYVTHRGGHTAYCAHCDKEVYWYAWAMDGYNAADSHFYLYRDVDVTKLLSLENADKNYTLVIDLAGHTWTRTNNVRAIKVGNEESLYLMDSVGGGKVCTTGSDGTNGGVVAVATGGKFYLMGGTLEQLPSDTIQIPNGGVVNMSGNGSEFHMSGGKLLNGAANLGGALYTSNGIVNITGGVIENGTATLNGGNLCFDGATSVNLKNVTIIGGNAQKHGGNIYFSNGVSNYTVKNCKIVDGVAGDKGGNIYFNANEATLENCTVSGGKAGVFGNNIYHNKGTVTLAGGAIENGDLMTNSSAKLILTGAYKADLLNLVKGSTVDVSGLSAGASMKVNAEGVFTPEMNNAQAIYDAGYVVPGTEGAELKLDGKKLSMTGAVLPKEPEIDVTDSTICPHCGEKWENITWSAWTGANDPASGHYKLEKDMTTAHTNIASKKNLDAEILLDLNGHILKGNDGDYAMGVGLTAGSAIKLTIIDSVGGGEIQATGSNNGVGVLMMQNGSVLNLLGGTLRRLPSDSAIPTSGTLYVMNAKVNMYGGKICDGYTTATADISAGNVMLRGTSLMNMYGGEISGGYAAKNGGGVHVYGMNPVFNMYGGVIKDNKTDGVGGNLYVNGGTATIGGTAEIYGGLSGDKVNNIAVTGTLTINGGTIDGGITGSFKSLTLEGNPVIKANTIGLEIPSGKVVTLGELTEGAEVWVNASGVFTTENANAAAYATANYFKTNIEGASIEAQGKVLAVTVATEPEPEPEPQPPVYDPTVCPHCGVALTEITWTAWDGSADPAGGHYRLEGNLQSAHTNVGNVANKDAEIVLDLNGKTWKNESDYLLDIGTGENSAIKFFIIDSVGGGELQGTGTSDQPAGVISVMNGAELNIYGGTLRHLYSAENNPTIAGVLYANNATVNMFGGKITDGYVKSNEEATAGNVLLRGTTVFNMTGGEITNGHSSNNGGGVNVYANTATFNMTGGRITNNISDANGGNIYNLGTATISGTTATVSGGVAGGFGGNIYNYKNLTLTGVSGIDGDIYSKNNANGGCMTLDGMVTIPMGNSNGIMLESGETIDFGANFDAASTVYFGVGLASTKNAVFTADGTADYLNCFKPVGRTTSVEVNGTALQAARAGDTAAQQSWCPHCDQYVTWYRSSNMTGSGILDTYSHFFFNDGLSYTINTEGAEVVFDMGGKNISGTKQVFVLNGANTKLSILDTVGNGQIVGKGATSGTTSASNGGVINVSGSSTNATITIFSGKLALHETPNAFVLRGGVIAMNSGVLNIKGGIIANGKTTVDDAGGSGGNIYLQNTVLNMSGGLVTGGTAKANGGNIYLNSNASANITGGMIENGTVTTGKGGNLYIAGKDSTISNLIVRGGTTATNGGNVALDSAAKFTLNNVVMSLGSATKGGNLSIEKTTECKLTDCLIYGGTATESKNVFVAQGAAYNPVDCTIYD